MYVCSMSEETRRDKTRQDKTLSVRPMGESLDVKFGELGLPLPHVRERSLAYSFRETLSDR